MNISFFLIWMSLTLLSTQAEFIAYDCSGLYLNVTSFDSLKVGACVIPKTTQIQNIHRIKLLQKAETYSIYYQACYISVDYLITRCSAFEDAQMVDGGYYSEIIELGPNRCQDIHQKRVYYTPSGSIIGDLKMNETIHVSQSSVGQMDRQGNCEGSTFTNARGMTWHKVVVQAKYTIYLSEGIAVANSEDNTLVLPAGSTLKLSENYGLDQFKGEIVWNNDRHDCNIEEYDVLYDGPATLVHTQAPKTETYLVESNNIAFALRKMGIAHVCGVLVITTENNQLFIVADEYHFNMFQPKTVTPFNTKLFSYINSKFVYLEFTIKKQTEQLYEDIIMKQCNIEKKVLRNTLSLATTSLTEFAYTVGEGPGFRAIRSGEIIYLQKCRPVNVQIISHDACFDELPVSYNNKTYFMTPKNHILQNYGTQIECNDYIPTAFQNDDTWISLSPKPHTISPPQQLMPSTTKTWSYERPYNFMTNGIYAPEIINNLQKQFMYAQDASTVERNLVRQTMGYDTIKQHNYNVNNLISEQTINSLIESQLNKMWRWCNITGDIVSTIIGIVFICKLVHMIISSLLNVSLLYQTFGWSFKLIAGIFSNITHFIMHNAHGKKIQTVSTSNIQQQSHHLQLHPDDRNILV